MNVTLLQQAKNNWKYDISHKRMSTYEQKCLIVIESGPWSNVQTGIDKNYWHTFEIPPSICTSNSIWDTSYNMHLSFYLRYLYQYAPLILFEIPPTICTSHSIWDTSINMQLSFYLRYLLQYAPLILFEIPPTICTSHSIWDTSFNMHLSFYLILALISFTTKSTHCNHIENIIVL